MLNFKENVPLQRNVPRPHCSSTVLKDSRPCPINGDDTDPMDVDDDSDADGEVDYSDIDIDQSDNNDDDESFF